MESEEDQELEFAPELLEMIQPGKAVRVDYGGENINNEVRHIRAIVDEEYVVYRVWSKHRQRCVYHVDDLIYFQMLWRDGFLKAA